MIQAHKTWCTKKYGTRIKHLIKVYLYTHFIYLSNLFK